MADHADQAPPRLALLFTQRLAQVREREQVVWRTALKEPRPSHFPPASAAGEAQVLERGRRLQRALQPQRLGRPADQVGVGKPQQTAAVAVHQHQASLPVERENRDVDFGHDGMEERGGFLCAQALAAERVGQRVDLEHHVFERIGAAAGAGTDGEVAFAQRREKIRDRLQRPRDMASRQHRARDPDRRHGDSGRDGGGCRPRHRAQVEQGEHDRRGSAGQRQRQHPAVVAEDRHGLPGTKTGGGARAGDRARTG